MGGGAGFCVRGGCCVQLPAASAYPQIWKGGTLFALGIAWHVEEKHYYLCLAFLTFLCCLPPARASRAWRGRFRLLAYSPTAPVQAALRASGAGACWMDLWSGCAAGSCGAA